VAGILAGSSSGTLLAAALRYCREQDRPKRVCTLVCDSGNKYLSKMFNDDWMSDQGLGSRDLVGDLRDVVGRRQQDGSVVTVRPTDTLLVAYARMRMYDVSQLPVMDGARLLGILDESDLLHAAVDRPARLRTPVGEVMSTRLRTVRPTAPVQEVVAMIDSGFVPIVADGDEFLGLVTPIDLVNHLRRQALKS
jgi:cystathionine beta-synthase